ncbi:MAG: hypothetical protein HOA57_04055 [Candidatus Magasanikbacteria bacterium]|jgi:hypothetical protein|nr:hypothetical protein [Candidatus Magasanikbacteria bacterium]MBT4314639.1 hypothetical protein [Candidatus Magasanikbacteria bacterium]MBT4547060.1 hypothetical protein [Candidatus Magasanikbacteria bacterium]MBT6819520.1 hypothetical protein [Candidatus Magasanikbacteria bacterium]
MVTEEEKNKQEDTSKEGLSPEQLAQQQRLTDQEGEAGEALAGLEQEGLDPAELEVCKQRVWDKTTIFIVEDDPSAIMKSTASLKGVMPESGQDAEILSFTNLSDVKEKAPALIESSAGGVLMVIEDMEIPTENRGMPFGGNGEESMIFLGEAVTKWNEDNPDNQVDLRIIVNTTMAGVSVDRFEGISATVMVSEQKNNVGDIVRSDIEDMAVIESYLDSIKEGKMAVDDVIDQVIGGGVKGLLDNLLKKIKENKIDCDAGKVISKIVDLERASQDYAYMFEADKSLRSMQKNLDFDIDKIYEKAGIEMESIARDIMTKIVDQIIVLGKARISGDVVDKEEVNAEMSKFSFLKSDNLSELAKDIFLEVIQEKKGDMPNSRMIGRMSGEYGDAIGFVSYFMNKSR